jgi:hypothetical protein
LSLGNSPAGIAFLENSELARVRPSAIWVSRWGIEGSVFFRMKMCCPGGC